MGYRRAGIVPGSACNTGIGFPCGDPLRPPRSSRSACTLHRKAVLYL
ncbi:hypothetical protein YT1_3562 [Rhodococcus ruber]|nr:hypothetical protein YT1_3562 [Rhodococcus ruber]